MGRRLARGLAFRPATGLAAAVRSLAPLTLALVALLLAAQPLRAAGPENDHFDDALVLTGDSVTVSGTNVGATGEPGEPGHHDGSYARNSVWYTWTAPSTRRVAVETCGSRLDTTLGVYTGASVDSLTTLGTSDESGVCATRGGSAVILATTAGEAYRIAVDGWNVHVGEFVLRV